MCGSCAPTFDGYVFWITNGNPHTVFDYKSNPSEYRVRHLQSMIEGPLDLTIPYV